MCLSLIWNQSLSHLSGKSKKKKKKKERKKNKTASSLESSLLNSALQSLLSGSTLAAAIVIRLPHNLIQDQWRGAGKPEKASQNVWAGHQGAVCQLSFLVHPVCYSPILRKEKQIYTKDSQRGDIWVETWRNSEVHHVHSWVDSITDSVVKNPPSNGFNPWVWRTP